MFWCFPKFLVGRSAETLARELRGIGCDGVAIPVRSGYWVEPATLARDLPVFRRVCAEAGLSADYAVIAQKPAELAADPTPLAILAEHGVRWARIGYLQGDDPGAGFAQAQRQLAAVAAHAEKIGIRVVVQCHHGTWHASTDAAWHFVRDLPPQAIGVKIDPGNQCHEGRSDARRSLAVLGPHLAAVGVKDAAWERTPEGGWRCRWVDAPSGCAGWSNWCAQLRERAFAGPYIFHAFAHEREPDVVMSALGGEIAWLRAALAVLAPEKAKG